VVAVGLWRRGFQIRHRRQAVLLQILRRSPAAMTPAPPVAVRLAGGEDFKYAIVGKPC
jgi:hypothetical protein